MTIDQETNQLYLADTLEPRYPSFAAEFTALLRKHRIEPKVLPGTRDIWCRDYMPVQADTNRLIGFTFAPAYLNDPRFAGTRSDNRQICDRIGLEPQWSNIVLDGGNVVKWKNKAIVTDIIYKDNPGYERKQLREELQNLLEIDDLVVIPRQPYDFTGHADGMIRFLDERTVLVNDYVHESERFQQRLARALRRHKLNTEPFPYGYEHPGKKGNPNHAQGIYINFLHIGNLIVVPQFWLLQDEDALHRIEQLYPQATIEGINANGVAQQGGVLNCLTWTMKA